MYGKDADDPTSCNTLQYNIFIVLGALTMRCEKPDLGRRNQLEK
jgi:hypothetical protein